jgi:hypothetical protein
VLPEVVNWKTGGVIKSMASAGIVKGDVNGHVQGAHSRNSITSPIEILIYASEGSAITEYQLVHLHEQSNAREFRTITGGIMHVSGGAQRDLLPFEGKKIANRTYRVILTSMGAGEYAFLPPGAFTSSTGAASLGKMYSFRILEEQVELIRLGWAAWTSTSVKFETIGLAAGPIGAGTTPATKHAI